MPLIRPTALRSLQSTLRYSGARATARTATARTQLVAKRFASGDGHGGGHGESSDMPWLLAALAITPPSCWYLWPDNSSHGHDDHGSHDEHHEGKEESSEEPSEEEEEEEKEEQASGGDQEAVEKADEKADEKTDEKEEDRPEIKQECSDEKIEDKKEGGKEKENKKSEDVNEDKKTKAGKPEEKTTSEVVDKEKKSTDTPGRNSKERTFTVGASEEQDPENKGASTSSSTKGMKLGDKTSKAPAAAPRGKSDGDMSKKQEGLSNTDTKYSVPIDQGSEKSKKGDGQPETAKSKGTVDPYAEAPKPPISRDD